MMLDLALDRDGILQVSALREEHRPRTADQHRQGGRAMTRRNCPGAGAHRLVVRGGAGGRRRRATLPNANWRSRRCWNGRGKVDSTGEEDRQEMIDLIETIQDAMS